MRRSREVSDASADDPLFLIPTDIWLSIVKLLTPFPLRLLIVLSSLNKGFYESLLLEKSREALLSLGVGKIRQIISSGSIYSLDEITFFLDDRGNVFTCARKYQWTPIQVPNLSGIQKIISDISTFFLNDKGEVFACGNNYYGQLGIGNKDNQCTPIQVPNLSGIQKISSGVDSTFFLNDKGEVFALGRNEYGQLGVGNKDDQCTPIQVPNLSGIQKIISETSEDGPSTFFINDKGEVFACGGNAYGQLGVGLNENEEEDTPIQLTSMRGIKHISMGCYMSTLFLNDQGNVFVSGNNNHGQLGIGNKEDQYTPVQQSTLIGIRKIIVEGNSAFFLNDQGNVFVSGDNAHGELGIAKEDEDEYEDDRCTPIQRSDLTGIKQIKRGYYSIFFLNDEGAVFRTRGDRLGMLTGIKKIIGCMHGPTILLNNDGDVFRLLDDDTPIQLMLWAPIRQDVENNISNHVGNIIGYGDNKYGHLGICPTDTLIPWPTYALQRQKNLVERWDVKILAQLAADSCSYNKLCYEALMQKLWNVSETTQKECFEILAISSFAASAKRFRDILEQTQTECDEILAKTLSAPSAERFLDILKQWCTQTDGEKQPAPLGLRAGMLTKLFLPYITDIYDALRLLELAQIYDDEGNPYCLIPVEYWQTMMILITEHLEQLIKEEKQKMWQEEESSATSLFQSEPQIMNTYTTYNVGFFPSDESIDTDYDAFSLCDDTPDHWFSPGGQ